MTTPADPNTRLPEEVLVHGSPDRTILSRRDPTAGGPAQLWKILETGSGLDAEREVALGQQLAGIGVATYLEARREEGSGKPVVVMDHHDGQNLEDFVARMGALPPRLALPIAARIAEILSRMHRTSIPDAPHGIVHCDIKPSNILCDPARLDDPERLLLLDLEHATAAPATTGNGDPGSNSDSECFSGGPISGSLSSGGPFSGGTVGFAPPEADRGAPPTPAFDIYALGVTLQFMLTGRHPDRPEREQWAALPTGVATLLDRCLDPDPAARPSASDAMVELERLAAAPDDELDKALGMLQEGKVEQAAATLDEIVEPLSSSTRAHALRAWLRRAREVAPPLPPSIGTIPMATRENLPGSDSHPTLATFADRVADTIAKLQDRLDLFPRCLTTLQRRRECRQGAAQVLTDLPALLQEFEREAQFDAARQLLLAGRRTAEAVLSQPGSFAIPGVSPRLLNPLQRSPLQFLERAEARLEEAATDYDQTIARLGDAEAALDLSAMEEVIRVVAREGGGARMAVAALRDRVHRLGFYLDRLAAPIEVLRSFAGALGQQDTVPALTTLLQFLERCATRAPGLLRQRSEDAHLDLRRLRRTLKDLHGEFPRVATKEPIAALDAIHATITDEAWKLVTAAETQLQSVPVPVRPLLSTLNRLDDWCMAGAFVDRPQRRRSDLLDAIESVRLDVERARATRDSMASGAEQAIARGHWTTALYDMERAVEHFAEEDQADDEPGDSDELKLRYAEVKRRKAELEAAMRENVELASQYTALLDQPDSTTQVRLALLEKRRALLSRLVNDLQEDRAHRYRQDLREVDVLVVQEHAARAERLLDESDDPTVWVNLARETLTLLDSPAARGGDAEPPGRIQRMIDHWQHRLDQAQREVDRRTELAKAQAPNSRGRTLGRIGALAAVAALVLVAWQWGPALAGSRAPDVPSRASVSRGELRAAVGEIDNAPLPTLLALAERLGAQSELLGTELASGARDLGNGAAAIAEAKDPSAAVAAFVADLQRFDRALAARASTAALAESDVASLTDFGERAWTLAAVLAHHRGVDLSALRGASCSVLSWQTEAQALLER